MSEAMEREASIQIVEQESQTEIARRSETEQNKPKLLVAISEEELEAKIIDCLLSNSIAREDEMVHLLDSLTRIKDCSAFHGILRSISDFLKDCVESRARVRVARDTLAGLTLSIVNLGRESVTEDQGNEPQNDIRAQKHQIKELQTKIKEQVREVERLQNHVPALFDPLFDYMAGFQAWSQGSGEPHNFLSLLTNQLEAQFRENNQDRAEWVLFMHELRDGEKTRKWSNIMRDVLSGDLSDTDTDMEGSVIGFSRWLAESIEEGKIGVLSEGDGEAEDDIDIEDLV